MSSRFEPRAFTAEEVRARREVTGESMMEAKACLRAERLSESFDDLRDRGTLEEKVEWLLDRFAEKARW